MRLFLSLICLSFFVWFLAPDSNAQAADTETKLRKAIVDVDNVLAQVNVLTKKLKEAIKDLPTDILELEPEGAVLKGKKSRADLLANKLDDINVAASKAEAARAEIFKDLIIIYDRIVAIAKEKNNHGAGNNRLHELLVVIVNTLADNITDDGVIAQEKSSPLPPNNQTLRKTLALLQQKLLEFNTKIDADPAQVDLLNQIVVLNAKIHSFSKPQLKVMEGVGAAAKVLAKTLSSEFNETFVVPDIGTVTSILKTADHLVKHLPKEDGTDDDKLVRRELLKDIKTRETLVKLETKISDFNLSDAGLVVRIVDAKLGDTHPLMQVNEYRWCDATAALRGACDRKSNCAVPPNHNSTLCGYDPAPAADPRHRGLYVLYECVANVNSNFSTIYGDGSKHVSTENISEINFDEYVILRGGGQIVCSKPKK